MIEEEGGRVDQSPGEILGAGESAVSELFRTEFEVFAEQVVSWVSPGRTLELDKSFAKIRQFGVDGEGLFRVGQALVESFQAGIAISEIFCNFPGLFVVSLLLAECE